MRRKHPFTAKISQKEFDDMIDEMPHYAWRKRHSNIDEYYKCDICDEILRKPYINTHIMSKAKTEIMRKAFISPILDLKDGSYPHFQAMKQCTFRCDTTKKRIWLY